MSLKNKYDKAEELTDEVLDRIRQSQYSVAIVAVVFLILLGLFFRFGLSFFGGLDLESLDRYRDIADFVLAAKARQHHVEIAIGQFSHRTRHRGNRPHDATLPDDVGHDGETRDQKDGEADHDCGDGRCGRPNGCFLRGAVSFRGLMKLFERGLHRDFGRSDLLRQRRNGVRLSKSGREIEDLLGGRFKRSDDNEDLVAAVLDIRRPADQPFLQDVLGRAKDRMEVLLLGFQQLEIEFGRR